MTDEEIEIAIASDPDETDLSDDWLENVEIVRYPDSELKNEKQNTSKGS
jgi:hypothetical protein